MLSHSFANKHYHETVSYTIISDNNFLISTSCVAHEFILCSAVMPLSRSFLNEYMHYTHPFTSQLSTEFSNIKSAIFLDQDNKRKRRYRNLTPRQFSDAPRVSYPDEDFQWCIYVIYHRSDAIYVL